MRNNTKKGFTLVELLVVIAILAILATVSVVGYTSFIERANVSNDQNIAAQLNNFLDAVKADSKGPYYEELQKNGITADNVNEITDFILSDSVLNTLVPQAEQYGYHFYFDLTDQEYKVLHDDEAVDAPTGFEAFLKPTAAGKPNSLSPSNCFTKENGRYCLVDTESAWAKLLDRYNEVTSKEDLQKLYDDAKAMVNEHKSTIPGFAYLIEKTTFVTEKGNFVVKVDEERNVIVVQGAATVKEDGTQNEYVITGTLFDLFDNMVIISASNPLFTPNDDKKDYVIELPEDVDYIAPNFTIVTNPEKEVTNEDGTTTMIPTYDVTVTLGKETADEIKDIVEINTTVSGVVIENNKGENVTIEGTEVTVGESVATIEAKNKVTSFSYAVSNEKPNKVDTDKNFIAWDGGTFTLTADNFKGEKSDEVLSKDVNWTIAGVYYFNEAREKVYLDSTVYSKYISTPVSGQSTTFTLSLPAGETVVPVIDGIEITAKPLIGTDESAQTITLKVLRATGVTGVKLGTNSVIFGGELSLENGILEGDTQKNTSYTLNDNYTLVPNYTESTTVKLDAPATMVGSTNLVVTNGITLTLKSDLKELLTAEEITVNFGNYFSKTFKVSMYNILNLSFSATNDKIVLVGDDNKVTIDELIKLNDGFDAPNNAQIWFMKSFSQQFAKPGTIAAKGFALDNVIYEENDKNLVKIDLKDGKDWGSTEIQFANGATTSDAAAVVTVVVVVPEGDGYRCISQPRNVSLVDGYNIRKGEYETLQNKVNAGNSIVLLDDVVADVENAYFTINEGKTFYGNCFTLDMSENGYMGGVEGIARYGIIELAGRLQDTKIVGKVYGTFAGSAEDKFGTNLVLARGNATIYNCYLSNTRAPLIIQYGGTVTVEDTVLFGGRYANVDIRNGHLIVKGNVTTIQQVVEGLDSEGKKVEVIGLGITGWFADEAHLVTVSSGANLTQYNFLSEDYSDDLPPLKYSGVTLMDLKEPFEKLFSDSQYSEYLHPNKVGETTTKYIHTGFVSLDKYLFNYSIKEYQTGTYGFFDKNFNWVTYTYLKTGDKVEINIAPLNLGNNTSDVTVTVTYDKKYYKAPDGTQTGTYTTTVSKSGATLAFTADMSSMGVTDILDWLGDRVLGIDMAFNIVAADGESYSSMNITDNSGANAKDYARVEYKMNLGGAISALAQKVADLHGKGIHSQNIVIDVNTYKVNKTNKAILQEYLAAVKDGTYLPSNYELTVD